MLRLRLVTSQGSPYPSRSPRAHPSGWTRTQGLSHRDSTTRTFRPPQQARPGRRLARTASEASMAARAGARFNLVLKKDVSIRPQVLLSGTRRSPGGLCRDSRDPRGRSICPPLSSSFARAIKPPSGPSNILTAQRCSRAAFPANPSVFPCAARALAKTKNQAWPGLA